MEIKANVPPRFVRPYKFYFSFNFLVLFYTTITFPFFVPATLSPYCSEAHQACCYLPDLPPLRSSHEFSCLVNSLIKDHLLIRNFLSKITTPSTVISFTVRFFSSIYYQISFLSIFLLYLQPSIESEFNKHLCKK